VVAVKRAVCALPVEAVDPRALGRCAWETERAARDVELLAWIGRFRFATAGAVADRFEFSRQQANAHVRRLAGLGLVGCERQHVSQARAVYLTGRGHDLLGWPRRRPPRARLQREHEEAIVWLAIRLEREAADHGWVLTERECRQLEARDDGFRFSVPVAGGERGTERRWPDLVVQAGVDLRAYEIEFAPKGTRRLRHIVDAYETSSYAETTFMVKSLALGRRIAALTGRHSPDWKLLGWTSRPVRVVAWPGLPAEQHAALAAALEGLARTRAGTPLGEPAAPLARPPAPSPIRALPPTPGPSSPARDASSPVRALPPNRVGRH